MKTDTFPAKMQRIMATIDADLQRKKYARENELPTPQYELTDSEVNHFVKYARKRFAKIMQDANAPLKDKLDCIETNALLDVIDLCWKRVKGTDQ